MTLAPDYAEPLLGFRAWRVDDRGHLKAITALRQWSTGANRAVCRRPTRESSNAHPAPAPNCGCGLYGLHQLSDAAKRDPAFVVGAIAAWGNIEVHHLGFRAEDACVVALAYRDSASERELGRLRRAAEHYGVELVGIGELQRAAEHFAAPLTEEALPPLRPAPRHRALGEEL